jgi:fatty-acyl-CoA synthase
MPLFHSNALFLGFHPAFHVCGSLAMRERFSASAFVPDVFRHGVTYWNYVGEPVHYVLSAIEKEYGGDVDRIHAQVTNDPRNRLRDALGNGAAAPDIERFMDWLGWRRCSSSTADRGAISTFRKKSDPRARSARITDQRADPNGAGVQCPRRSSIRWQDRQLRRGGRRDSRRAGLGLFQGY